MKKLNSIPETDFSFEGLARSYIEASIDRWLLIAPKANPAMLEIFRDRDSPPLRAMVPWAGEFAGKYLTSASQVYAATGDTRLFAWLKDFTRMLIGFQAENGYLGPWPHGFQLSDGAPNSMNGLWDTWGHYHMMLGLLFWSNVSGEKQALNAAEKIADLLCRKFLGDNAARMVDTGCTEKNLAPVHGLCLLHQRLGAKKYLDLALQIVSEFSAKDTKGESLAGDYFNDALEGKEFFQMLNPRWESLHQIQALAELYHITADERYAEAFKRNWWSMAKGDRHNNGGFTSGEQATGNPYNPEPIETCCTIAWMTMSVDMLKMTGNPVVADELELSFFNSVIGMHSPTGRWATYNTPMNGFRRASAHSIVFQAREGSSELNCCSVNSPRGFGLLSEWAVMADETGVVLNYYGPGTGSIPMKNGSNVMLQTETEYPADGKILIHVNPEQPIEFSLKLRIPAWSRDTAVSVNGTREKDCIGASYLVLKKRWEGGDTIRIDMDMSLHFWEGQNEFAGLSSIYRGPLLLVFDHRYNLHLAGSDYTKVHDSGDWKNTNDLMLTIPALDARNLVEKRGQWKHWLPPYMLLEFESVDGKSVRLCDFGSAGEGGTPYMSWLPVENVPDTSDFIESNPLRSVHI